MKSSRSVSCSAPLKGDAMAATLLCSGIAKRREMTGVVPPRCRKAPNRAHACLALWAGAYMWGAPPAGGLRPAEEPTSFLLCTFMVSQARAPGLRGHE